MSRFFYLNFLLPTVYYSLINFNLAFDDAVPGEVFVDAFAGAGEKIFDQCRVCFEALECVGKRDRVFLGDEDSGLPIGDDIRDAADVACYDRQSKFHGFDEHDSEAFGVALAIDDGGEHKDVGGAVFVCESFWRKLAREDDRRRRFFDSTKIDWILHFVQDDVSLVFRLCSFASLMYQLFGSVISMQAWLRLSPCTVVVSFF